jgi:drug/metabolite transporter (DMT)-like permease
VALGILFFGLFPLLFNASLIFTMAARGALALATAPVLTMAVGTLLGVERPTRRKALGMVIAMSGVVLALGGSVSQSAPHAWIGDLLMCGAAFCMAFYNVWSRTFVARSARLSFAALGMGCGTVCLALAAIVYGGASRVWTLGLSQWIACMYLAIVCGVFIFFLWAFALGRIPPSVVSLSIAINPVTAAIFGQVLLKEAISPNLLLGLGAVIGGIAVASKPNQRHARAVNRCLSSFQRPAQSAWRERSGASRPLVSEFRVQSAGGLKCAAHDQARRKRIAESLRSLSDERKR